MIDDQVSVRYHSNGVYEFHVPVETFYSIVDATIVEQAC
jgi:hypothetical protein